MRLVSARYALLATLLVMGLGMLLSFAIAHSSGPILVAACLLLAPVVGLIGLSADFGLPLLDSAWVFWPLALLFQFLYLFVVVHAIRLIWHRWIKGAWSACSDD
jgi:hypothetical protein